MMTPAEANVLRIEIEKLQEKVELMRKLSTASGFYSYYFSKILEYPSNKACFHSVNELYHELFGQYRYSDYDYFRVSLTRFNKKEKK
ncbi:hypothetical protein [Flavobacterium sp. CFS9]